ncbi:c-type cytochrome domain-containing protein [Spirosoma sp. 209]|uniref:c-type cytochrome domain-containing protein n=1 Tax=Spirosoma sp. 209 TaxID=1955701 RepID=UPI00098D0ED2|nr:c-type cytochrome domain-containing protein [Spirosoma sp. 209]
MPSTELWGRLHPLLVHLPIGILLFAVGLMVYGRLKKLDVEAAVSLAWGLGAASALLACGAGWLLAQSGDYDADMVARHQWTGLATAGLATLTFLLKQYRWPVAFITVGLLTLAGHYGGNLTHGQDYLFPDTRQLVEQEPAAQPAIVSQPAALQTDSVDSRDKPIIRRTFLYRDQVVPILKTKCYSCHSATKKKGGLRLDTEVFIRQGGKNGSILTAGNAQKSKLFTYLLLPEGDDNHMPPKGKLQLTPQQITTIYHWIQKGASFSEQVDTLQPTRPNQLVALADVIPSLPLARSADSSHSIADEIGPRPISLESTVLARPVDAASPTTLARLTQQQVSLSKLTDGANYLSANFVNVKTYSPALLAALGEVGAQVVHLRLSGQPVTDADLDPLASLTNLTRLNLARTSITDKALTALTGLPNLEQLNLYGTAVTDEGLAILARCPNLKVVYLWQTKTTPEGIERLQKRRPNLKIDTGTVQLARPGVARPDSTKIL